MTRHALNCGIFIESSPNKVRDGVHIVLGQRDDEAEGSRLVMMVVTEPESQVTKDHLSYLHKVGKKKSADKTALSSELQTPDNITEIAKNNKIRIFEPSEIGSGTESQSEGGLTRQSDTNSQTSNHNGSYEVYPSRIHILSYGLFMLIVGLGMGWWLINGFSLGFRGDLMINGTFIFATPLCLIGGVWLVYRSVKNDPVLTITTDGIRCNDSLGSAQFFSWENIKEIEKMEADVQNEETGRSTQVTEFRIHLKDMSLNGIIARMAMSVSAIIDDSNSDIYKVGASTYAIDFDEVAGAVNQHSDVPITSSEKVVEY